MDWKKFLQSLLEAKNQFLADANKALKPLPPIEQHEASGVVGYALRELNNCFQWITTTCMRLDTDLQELIQRGEQIIADCNKTYVAEQITAGVLIPKERIDAGDYLSKEVAQQTATAAAEKAANDREQEVMTRIQLLASRRNELCTEKVGADGKKVPALLSREVVDKLSDEFLKADDYLAKAGTIASRLGDVAALGINVPGLLARAAELPLDEAGNLQFSEQLSMIRAAAGKTGTTTTAIAPFAMQQSGGNNQASELEGVF